MRMQQSKLIFDLFTLFLHAMHCASSAFLSLFWRISFFRLSSPTSCWYPDAMCLELSVDGKWSFIITLVLIVQLDSHTVVSNRLKEDNASPIKRKWVTTKNAQQNRSNTARAAQTQKRTRDWKFWI